MEYEDELERMRNRRRNQKARQQQRMPDSSRPRRGPGREEDLIHTNFDERQGSKRPRSQGAGGRRQGGRSSGYYDDSYEYGRGGYNEEDEYYSRSGYSEEDDYGGYDQSRHEDYEDGYDGRRGRHSGGGRRETFRGAEGVHQSRAPKPSGGRKEKSGKKKKHGFLKLIILLIILAGAYFVFKYKQTGTGFWTIAIFGVDSRDGKLEKGALSDVEMICVIDRGSGDIKLVSVFRDTYLEIHPDGTYHKINEAYFKGGHEQAVQALERNLDLTIDDYATFNWKAVVDAVNILGGIDLEISDSEFKYINSFITETVESTGIGSHHLEHAGMNHLDGVQAVAYARLRLMDTDYNRTARQRLVIQLAMNKAKESDLKTLTTLVRTILPQISTSIGADDVFPMARNIKKFQIGETGGFPFSRGETHIGKKDCVIPLTLESNVVQLHQFLYGTENFQPSETVRRISAKVASDSGMGQVAENAPEAKVLGQRALEGGSQDSGNSGSGSPESTAGGQGSENGANNPAGEAPNPAPETMPPQQPETPQESQEEESSQEDVSSSEETQDETTSSDQEQNTLTSTEESGTEPQNPPGEQPEIGPGITEASTEAATEAAVEAVPEQTAGETAEVGPGLP